MGQVLGPDKIGALTKLSATTVSLAATRVTIGGQQYAKTSAIVINAATTGVNALDTGTVAAESIYYVHAIISAGALALVASLSKTAPTGHTNFKWTGWVFVTDSTAVIATTENSTTWNWISYAPVAPTNGSFPTSVCYARYRRVGDSAECEITATASGSALTFLQLSFIDSLTIDSAKLSLDTSVHGIAHLNDGGQINIGGIQVFTPHYISFMGPDGDTGNWSGAVPIAFSAGNILSARFTLPVVGWKANEL